MDSIAIFACGIFTWTFLEYLIHGWLSHTFQTFATDLHRIHHRDPRAVFTIGAWLPIATFWIAGTVLSGFSPAIVYLTGILIGFGAYETVHYRIHFRAATNPIERYLRVRHLLHHQHTPRLYLSVTSPLWDLIFGTEPLMPADATALSASTAPLRGPTNLRLLFCFHYLHRA